MPVLFVTSFLVMSISLSSPVFISTLKNTESDTLNTESRDMTCDANTPKITKQTLQIIQESVEAYNPAKNQNHLDRPIFVRIGDESMDKFER